MWFTVFHMIAWSICWIPECLRMSFLVILHSLKEPANVSFRLLLRVKILRQSSKSQFGKPAWSTGSPWLRGQHWADIPASSAEASSAPPSPSPSRPVCCSGVATGADASPLHPQYTTSSRPLTSLPQHYGDSFPIPAPPLLLLSSLQLGRPRAQLRLTSPSHHHPLRLVTLGPSTKSKLRALV